MLNLMASSVAQEYEFVPFTTSRPPKINTLDNWGYGAIFRGGILRLFVGAAITIWHIAKFPFVVRSRKIQLVQIQASDFLTFWESAAYLLLTRMLMVPAMMRIGGAFDQFYSQSSLVTRFLIQKVLGLPAYLIAQSELASQFISSVARNTPIVVLPNWVKNELIVNVDRKPTTNPVFLFIAGNEARRKGIDDVLEAARHLNLENSPARFHILAAPPILAETISNLKLQNISSVDGPVAHTAVLEAMRASDALLLPSHGEGFPNSLVEAMACGLPSIVTPVNSVPDIVSRGGARIVPVGNPVALASAINELSLDESLRRRLGAEALRNLCSRFTEQCALPSLRAAYRDLLQEKP